METRVRVLEDHVLLRIGLVSQTLRYQACTSANNLLQSRPLVHQTVLEQFPLQEAHIAVYSSGQTMASKLTYYTLDLISVA